MQTLKPRSACSDLQSDKGIGLIIFFKCLNIFFLFLRENVVLTEALLMSTHNMFSWRNKKVLCRYPFLSSFLHVKMSALVRMHRQKADLGLPMQAPFFHDLGSSTLKGTTKAVTWGRMPVKANNFPICKLPNPEPSCSKRCLLIELVKGHFVNCFSGFNTQYSDIFCWKNVSIFAKATHIFSAKNFSIFAYHSL